MSARVSRVAAPRRVAIKVRADAKDLTFDMKSRIKIQEGIDKLADAVAVTLGPRGACPAVPPRAQRSPAPPASPRPSPDVEPDPDPPRIPQAATSFSRRRSACPRCASRPSTPLLDVQGLG